MLNETIILLAEQSKAEAHCEAASFYVTFVVIVNYSVEPAAKRENYTDDIN